MRAIALADALIRLGEHDTVLAGGMESMTNAPYLAQGARQGYRFGDAALIDAMICRRRCATRGAACRCSSRRGRRRELGIDARRAGRLVGALAGARRRGHDRGRFAEEIVPVVIPGRKGDTVVDTDEGPRRDTSLEALAALQPLVPGGSHTAGNSPGVNDGAAAVVVASEAEAERRGLQPLAHHPLDGRHRRTAATRWRACRRWRRSIALEKAGLTVADVDRWEINEAFASVARQLDADARRRRRTA